MSYDTELYRCKLIGLQERLHRIGVSFIDMTYKEDARHGTRSPHHCQAGRLKCGRMWLTLYTVNH